MAFVGSYPVLMTEDVKGTAAFYREHFGFEVTFEADWYVQLRREQFELAVLDAGHETVPAAWRGRTAGGMLFNVEVDDVDAEYERLSRSLPPVLPIRTEEFGQRHFIVAGPDGVLVDVITNIEPAASYAENFRSSHNPLEL